MNIRLFDKWKMFVLCAVIVLCAFLFAPVIAEAEDKTPVEKPTLDAEYVYDGTAKTVTLPQSKYYISDSVTCINAGTYSINVSLIDKNLYCWDDKTTDDITLHFTVKKAVFDESSLYYGDETHIYDGKEHFIDVEGLPSSASVIFNTVKSEPGIYPSVARIDLGKNYENRIIELDGATLTILAVELKDDGGSFIDLRGFSPKVEFSLGRGKASDFKYKLPAGGGLYEAFAPYATLGGEKYDFGKGEFTYRVLVPTRYIGVKVYVNDNGQAKEVPLHWSGHYVVFSVDEMREFAVVYSGIDDGGQPQLLWLEILLGVIIIVEAVVIVKQALVLKKK